MWQRDFREDTPVQHHGLVYFVDAIISDLLFVSVSNDSVGAKLKASGVTH